MTHTERAARLWHAYGREDRAGRYYVGGEYIGKRLSQTTSRAKGMSRGLILSTTDPIAVVAVWLARS